MKRPTRVPASSVVRMNSASNMIAKWYQSAIAVGPAEHVREHVRHADRETRRAAGAREQRRLADVAARAARMLGRVRARSPSCESLPPPLAAVVPMSAGRRVDREVDAGREHAGGDQRHHRDQRLHAASRRSRSMRASGSRSSSFGVVPDEISAWKPEIAPQAIVMKRTGTACPAKTGPAAVDELRERRHLQRRQHDQDADRQREHDADLDERREVVARREQQPHRQHRRGEAVGHDRAARASSRSSVNIGASVGLSATHVPTNSATTSSTRPIARRLEHAARAEPAHVDAHEHARSGSSGRRSRSPTGST